MPTNCNVRSEFYYIVNLHSGLALEGGHSPAKDAKEATYLYQVEHQIDTPAQIWEFAIPYAPISPSIHHSSRSKHYLTTAPQHDTRPGRMAPNQECIHRPHAKPLLRILTPAPNRRATSTGTHLKLPRDMGYAMGAHQRHRAGI